MEELALVEQIARGLVFQVVAGGLGLVLGVVAGVLLLQRRRIPPVLTSASVALPALAATGVGAWVLRGPGPLPLAASTAAWAQFVSFLVTVPVAGVVLFFLAVAGTMGSPRRWGRAAVVAALVVATVAVTAVGGVVCNNPLYAVLRAGVYASLGLLVVAATVGGDPRRACAEASAAAAVSFPLLVAAGECSERGIVHVLILAQLERLEPAVRAQAVEDLLELVAPELWWGTASILLGCATAVVGVVGSLPSSQRARFLLALVWLPLALLPLWGPGLGHGWLLEVARALP